MPRIGSFNSMNRITVIRTLMRQKNLKNYLEIGVFNGHVFFRVRSKLLHNTK